MMGFQWTKKKKYPKLKIRFEQEVTMPCRALNYVSVSLLICQKNLHLLILIELFYIYFCDTGIISFRMSEGRNDIVIQAHVSIKYFVHTNDNKILTFIIIVTAQNKSSKIHIKKILTKLFQRNSKSQRWKGCVWPVGENTQLEVTGWDKGKILLVLNDITKTY